MHNKAFGNDYYQIIEFKQTSKRLPNNLGTIGLATPKDAAGTNSKRISESNAIGFWPPSMLQSGRPTARTLLLLPSRFSPGPFEIGAGSSLPLRCNDPASKAAGTLDTKSFSKSSLSFRICSRSQDCAGNLFSKASGRAAVPFRHVNACKVGDSSGSRGRCLAGAAVLLSQ